MTLAEVFNRFVRFAGVGVLGTLAHYAVLVTLVQLAMWGSVLASTAGFLVGALVNYSLNYRYTFHSCQPHPQTLAKFLLIAAVGIGLNALVMGLGARADMHYLVTQIGATGLVLLWNFTGNLLWTFKN